MAKQKQQTRVSLTDTRVKDAKAGAGVVRIWDSTVPGFHLRVTPAGAKSFCVTFQRKNGQKVNITIGKAETWTVKAASEKAAALRKLHDEGKDARAYVQEERSGQDVDALIKVWREDYRHSLKPTSQASYDSLMKVIVSPMLGKRLVKDLSYQDVKDMHRKAKKGGHETNANRAVAILSRLLSIAEKEGWRAQGTNPCGQLEKPSEKPRSRVLAAEEYAALEGALVALVAAGEADKPVEAVKPTKGKKPVKVEKLDPQAADLIRFLAFSGLRKSEALGLRFADVDLERGVMRFEDHKTAEQAGTKVLPLNPHLRAIIQRRSGQKLGAFVFPGRKMNGPIVGLAKMWARVVVAAGLEDVTPHDLRRTFMSTSMELGYPAAIGDALLGHSLGKIRDTYIHLGSEGIMATASRETADWIAAAMTGDAVRPGVKVAAAEKEVTGTA